MTIVYGSHVRVSSERDPSYNGSIGVVIGMRGPDVTRVALLGGGPHLGLLRDEMVEVTPEMCQHCGYPVPR